MKVYELTACEEYQWQESLGLFASREAAMRSRSRHSTIIQDSDDGLIIALPERADAVRHALESQAHYWWYSLPRHGMTENYEEPVFFGIFEEEVHE